MAGRLAGRAALVTGSSRGIGAAIARRLAADGARVAVHGRADSEALRALAAGMEAVAVTGDLADAVVPERLVVQAAEALGGLDILVLNAGGVGGGALAALDPAKVDGALAVDLRATILAVRAFAEVTRSRHGRVVYISSGMATQPAPGVALAAAAKAGSEAFIRCAAQELGARGITLNTVAPGCTETDRIAGQSWPGKVPGWTALRRLGAPEDIADVVAFLASDEARWLTGLTIQANGGQVTTAANIMAAG